MDAALQAILASPLTPASLFLAETAIIIVAFSRGWIVSAHQVSELIGVQNLRIAEAVQRGSDWQQAYYAERRKNEALTLQLEAASGVLRETVGKMLPTSSVPRTGDTP